MAKKTPLTDLGFDQLGKVKPLAPLGTTPDPLGFDTQVNSPSPYEGPTPSEQYTPGYIAETSLKDHIAANQDGWDQFANFFEQTGVGALAGTIETASYMADFEQHWNWLKGEETEYKNWLGEGMKKIVEENKELFPIYLSEKNEGFEPSSAEWWAHHGGSGLGTVLGLLVPGLGVAKLGKLAGMGKTGQAISATVASRTAESTMEANQVFEESYKTLLDRGIDTETAKQLAGKAATTTWNTNWLFALQDFAQFNTILKGAKVSAKGAKGLGIKQFLGQSAWEGAEEAGQYTVQQEAKRLALESDADYFGAGFNKRLADYVDDDEFLTSTLLGAAGGGLFHVAGKAAEAVTEVQQGDYIPRIKEKIFNTVKRGLQKVRANTVDDTGTSQTISNVELANMYVDRLNKGKLNNYTEELEELKKKTETDSDVKRTIDEHIEDVEFLKTEEARLKNSPIPAEFHKHILTTTLEQRQKSRLQKQLSNELQALEQDLLREDQLTPELQQLKKLQISAAGYAKLAQTNPKFVPVAEQMTKAFEQAKQDFKAGNVLGAIADLDKVLLTNRDAALFEKAFQLISTQEQQKDLKDELAKVTTPEGLAQIAKERAEKKINAESQAVLNNPKATKEEILQAAANTTDEALKVELAKKHQALVDADKAANEAKTKALVDEGAPEAPEERLPDEIPFDFDPNFEVVPEVEDAPLPDEIPFAGGLSPEQAQKWGGLSPEQVTTMLSQLNTEQQEAKPVPTDQQGEKDIKASEARRDQSTVGTISMDHLGDEAQTPQKYHHVNGQVGTAEDVFAVEPMTGQLLVNTPVIQPGMTVTLKVENEFPWTQRAGFVPNSVDNYTINVYMEGVSQPLTQLRNVDNKKLNEPAKVEEQDNNRALRNRIIAAGGTLQTTITGKNLGSIRVSDRKNSVEIFQSDFVETPEGWSFQNTGHNPAFGFIDFNGLIEVPNLRSMAGMSSATADRIEAAVLELSKNTAQLSKMRGKIITFRTGPDGTMRIIGLEPNKLNENEVNWLIQNLPGLISSKNYTDLDSVVYMPKHAPGVYSANKGLPDVLTLDRRRIHLVNTTKTKADVLLPLTGEAGKKIWVILDSPQLKPMLSGQPFGFRIMTPDGNKTAVMLNHPAGPKIAEQFKKLLSNQFKNINKKNLNSEIVYTDPTDPNATPSNSYYEYLVKTGSLYTNLPGSKTLGNGKDSSYSFNQVSLYLDPNPADEVAKVDHSGETTIIHDVKPAPIPTPTETPTPKKRGSALDEIYGEGKLRAVVGNHKFETITEKELQWFKETYGEEFLTIAKNIDKIVTEGGVEAFGMYYNAMVTLAEKGETGSLAHEAMHLVLDPMTGVVSAKEREDILNAAAKAYGIERSYDTLQPKLRVTDSYAGPIAPLATEEAGETKAPKDYIDYFKKRYNLAKTKYGGPRTAKQKEKHKDRLDTFASRLRSGYVNRKFINQRAEAPKFAEIDKAGEIIPITLRFLENIKKNKNHSTSLERPFSFKDATPKENEVLKEFYDALKAEIELKFKSENKPVPKNISNDRLVDKLDEWLQKNYSIQAYPVPTTHQPYGLYSIISGHPKVEGGEVFISDGLHFPQLNTGHAKQLTDKTYSNTLGWYINAKINDSTFLYEFQSDILPEIAEGNFTFVRRVQTPEDQETGEIEFISSLPSKLSYDHLKFTRTASEAEVKNKIADVVEDYVDTWMESTADDLLHAEKHMRGDSSASRQPTPDAEIDRLIENANKPSLALTAAYIGHKKKTGIIKKLVNDYEKSNEANPQEFFNKLEKVLAQSIKPILELAEFQSPKSFFVSEADDVSAHIKVETASGRKYYLNSIKRVLDDIVTTNTTRRSRPGRRPAQQEPVKVPKTLKELFKMQKENKERLLKMAHSAVLRNKATETKAALQSEIGEYYEVRREKIKNYFKELLFEEGAPYQDYISEVVEYNTKQVMRELTGDDTKYKVGEDLAKLQTTYEHWYKVMFDKFIRVALYRAKQEGLKEVYLPTYASMTAIEGSKQTGRIYTTPFEDRDVAAQQKIDKTGQFEVDDINYVRLRPEDRTSPIDLSDDAWPGELEAGLEEAERRKAEGTKYYKGSEQISEEEYKAAAEKFVKSRRVGPFYAALSKIKGVKIQGLETPDWSKEPLLKVNLEEYNPVNLERFRTVTPDYSNLTNDAKIEEMLAEEFRNYWLSDGKIKPTEPKVKGFFARLMNFIKKLLGFKGPIEKLFYQVANTPLSQEQRLAIQNKAKGMVDPQDPKFRKLPGFKYIKQQQETIQAFSSEVIKVAHELSRKEEVYLGDFLTNKTNIQNVFEAVKANFQEDLERIKKLTEWTSEEEARYYSYLAAGIGSPLEGDDMYVGQYEDTTTVTGFPEDGFKSKVLKDLARYGFKVKLSDGTDYENNQEEDEQTAELENSIDESGEGEFLYAVDKSLINPSKSMSQRMKMFLALIPEPLTNEKGEYVGDKKTVFGTTKFLDFRKVDGNLTLKLRDSINPLTRLTNLAKNDPIARVVLNALMEEKNKGNKQLFNEFVAKYNRDGYYKKTVLYGTKLVNLKPSEIDPAMPNVRTRLELFAKTIDSDRASSDRVLHNRWREEGIRKKVTDTDGTVNQTKADGLLKRFNDFKAKYVAAQNKKSPLTFEETKAEFESLLGELGVTLHPNLWKEFDAIVNPGLKRKKLAELFFGLRSRTLEQLLENTAKGNDPYEGSTVLTTLSRMSSVYMEDSRGGAYRNDSGKQENPINWPSALTELINQVKNNNQSVFEYFTDDDFYKGNQFLNVVKANPDKIDLTFSSVSKRNNEDPKDFENRRKIDSIIMRLTTFYNNGGNEALIFTGTPETSTKQPILSLPKYKGTKDARDFLFTVLKNTMNSEITRIQKIKAFAGEDPLLANIKNYGKATKFVYIPGLNSIPNLVESLANGEVSPEQKAEALNSANAEINRFIDDHFMRFKNWLLANDVIEQSVKGVVTSNRIPEGLLDNREVETFLQEFYFNDLAWRMSVSQVLMGDKALYSDDDNYFKRAKHIVTPGIKGYSETPVTISIGVYPKQMKINTPEYLSELAKWVEDKGLIKAYEEINKTDAQSLADIDTYRIMADSIGQWSPDHERVYKIAWSKGITIRKATKELVKLNLITEEEGRDLMKTASRILLQPLKPSRARYRKHRLPDGKVIIIKEWFKDSITPITPELAVTHKGYEDLLAYMKTNQVGIMSAEDTVKVGLYGSITDLSVPMEQWQKRTISLEDIRYPQILPDKKKTKIKGTQFHKLALGNIQDKVKYKVGNTTMLGSTVKEKWNEYWLEKIQTSDKKLWTQLGVGENFELSEDPAIRKTQLYKLKLVLEQEFSSRDLNENYQDVLELIRIANDQIDFKLPISIPMFGQKFQSILSNLWRKKILAQDSPGYAAVNLADWGTGYDDELKFIQNENGEVIEAEIGLPLENLGKLGLKYGDNVLPNGRIVWDRLTEAQKQALQFILYRIPTSNKSSMIPVRVVKILPSNLNNVVMIPGELTVQQSLDFDVDKSQLLARVLTKDGSVDKDNVDTKLFDLYWGILTNPAHIEEVLTPLDSKTLTMKLNEYRNKGLIDENKGSSFASADVDIEAELKNKDAKAEIGITSRFNTGHTMLQMIKDFVSVTMGINIKVGNKYEHSNLGAMYDANGEVLISRNLAETQQAALDAANTPLLSYFNVVTGTMSSFCTMILYGIPLPVVTDFFMQPVIAEWTKFYEQEGLNADKATQRLFAEYPAIKNQYNALEEGTVKVGLTEEGLSAYLGQKIGTSTSHDARVLLEFRNIMTIASQLSKVNNVLSIDTFKDTTGIEAMEGLVQQVNDAIDPDKPVALDMRMFELDETPPVGKRLAAFYQYGVVNFLKYAGQFFPSATMPYRAVRTHFAVSMGQAGMTNKDSIKSINQFTDYFNLEHDGFLSRSLENIHPQKASYRTRWSFTDPKNTLWMHIDKMIDKYPSLKNNELIRNLETGKTYGEGVQMLGIRNTDGNTNKTEVTNGWYELLTSTNEEIRGLGHDLVRFATFTTGFEFNPRSMFELIPVSFWTESGVEAGWRNIVKAGEALQIDRDAVILNYVRHQFRTMKRFPEIYGKFTKEKGFISDLVKEATLEPGTQHITKFVLSDGYLTRGIPPRFIRAKNGATGEYHLYEQSPANNMVYAELQPAGEPYGYIEVSADGRAESRLPANRRTKASTHPWSSGPVVSKAFPLFTGTTLGENPIITQYLPEDKNHAGTTLEKLAAEETDVDTKKNIEALLRNVDKINTPVILAPLGNQLGVFEVDTRGISVIKIKPNGNVESESQMRHVLLHELNHAFSVEVLLNPVGKEQENFRTNVERLAKENNMDKFEFLAELASNKDFRAKLRKKGFWARVLRALRKLLGFTDQFDKVLDQYYDILDNAETLQAMTPGEYAMKEEKPVGRKRIDILAQALASLKSRAKLLSDKGKRTESKELHNRIKVFKELMKTKRNEAVINYILQVDDEIQKLKGAFALMAKSPDKVDPDTLYSMRQQLTSYKLLDAFADQIHLSPTSFVPEGGNSDILLKNLDDLRADVHKLNNNTRRLAIIRFASVAKKALNDPTLTLESLIDNFDRADRDVHFINRFVETGMEINDPAVKTAAKLLIDNQAEAYRKTQDDLYITSPKSQTATIVVKEKGKNNKFKWTTRKVNFTSVGMMKALSEYETWLKSKGKNINNFVDKFGPVIDIDSLEQNADGVHLISPWSPEGQRIMSIPESSPDFPLRQFYETFVMQYLKSQESIPAYSHRPGLRIPSIQRSMLEGLSREEGAGKFVLLKEAAIDKVRQRYDETDFKAVDQNGKPQEYIPVRFISKQDGQEGRLSTREVSLDLATTLPLFINESYKRQGLEALNADLELGKLVLAERRVVKTRNVAGPGLTPWLSNKKEGIPLASGEFDTIPGEQSNSYQTYDSLLKRFMYGEVKKNELDVELGGNKFSGAKMIDTLLQATGIKIMFANVAIPLTNLIMGEVSMIKEIVGGNVINRKDYSAGMSFFKKIALPSLADVGRREKKTKAGRILTYFNPVDSNRPVSDLGVDTNWMRTIWSGVTRTGGTSIEFYLGAKSIGAVFNRFKAINPEGKEVGLYDALEITPEGKVSLAKGYKFRGKDSISSADINEVRNYVLRTYQMMNGIYNTIDKPAANAYALGRLVGFMRNWLVPGIQARWKTKHFDERLNQENEGHYLSAVVAFNNIFGKNGFLKGSIDALRILTWFGVHDEKLLLLPEELELDEEKQQEIINLRKANIRKTLFELWAIIGITILMGTAWDDDDDSYIKYMLARVKRELSTFYSPQTGWEVLRSPSVALNFLDGIAKIQRDVVESTGSFITGDEQPRYQQGPHKGELKLVADLKSQFGLNFDAQFEALGTKTRLIQRGGYK
jgi:hypothetical protein